MENMDRLKKSLMPCFIAVVQWLINLCFRVDKYFFQYSGITYRWIVIKITYLTLLILFWNFIWRFVCGIKKGEKNHKRGLLIFGIYFSALMIIMIIVWPGTWSWDDIRTLLEIREYSKFFAWQHVLTGFYQDVFLQVIPAPVGIILLQNVCIAMIVSFFVVTMETKIGVEKIPNKVIDIIIKLIPFLLPPVLAYQFSGYRMGLYVYCELLAITMLIRVCYDKNTWKISFVILFCTICAVVAAWRTESFIYVLIVPIIVWLNKTVFATKKKRIMVILLFLIEFFLLNSWQNKELGDENYQIVSLLRPCVELIQVADVQENANEIESIERVISVKTVLDNPQVNGEDLYWKYSVVHSGYDKDDYKAFLSAFLRLAIEYPEVVINERIALAKQSLGIAYSNVTNIPEAAMLYEKENAFADVAFNKRRIGESPIWKDLRKRFIYLLGCRTAAGELIGPVFRIVWNVVIPIWILIYAGCKLLVRKKWKYLLIWGAVVSRIPIVLLTQPAGWIMYLLPFYFLGYVYLVYKLLLYFSKKSMVA